MPESPPPSGAALRAGTPTRFVPEADLDGLVADVGARLRPVCADMPVATFDALVRDIARLKARRAAAERNTMTPPRLDSLRVLSPTSRAD